MMSSNPLVPNPNDPGNFYTNQTRTYDAADPKQMYFEFTEHLFDYSGIAPHAECAVDESVLIGGVCTTHSECTGARNCINSACEGFPNCDPKEIFLNSQWENSPCNIRYRIDIHPQVVNTEINPQPLLMEPPQRFNVGTDFGWMDDPNNYQQSWKDHYTFYDTGIWPSANYPLKLKIYPKQGIIGRFVFRL